METDRGVVVLSKGVVEDAVHCAAPLYVVWCSMVSIKQLRDRVGWRHTSHGTDSAYNRISKRRIRVEYQVGLDPNVGVVRRRALE